MFEQIKTLLGKAIDSPEIISFLNANGYKYPPKPYITNRASDRHYWLEHKKSGMSLLFKIALYNKNYAVAQASKKGSYAPILTEVLWEKNLSPIIFPFNVDFMCSYNDLITILGSPMLKSSDASPTWLNDDGTESWYRWIKNLEGTSKDILFSIEWWNHTQLRYISLSIENPSPLFNFYDTLCYENIDTFLQKKEYRKTLDIFFIQWALDNDLIDTEQSKEGDIPDNEAPRKAISFIAHLNRGYLSELDFLQKRDFVINYINGIGKKQFLYQKDFANIFLTAPAHKNNYLSIEATTELNKIECIQENYLKMANIIDTRLKEFEQD